MGSRAGHINLQFRDQDTPIVDIHLEDGMNAGVLQAATAKLYEEYCCFAG